MRAYKFLDVHFGLKSIYERRLKQSKINELNDPFELIPYDLSDCVHRQAFLATRNQLNENRGVSCFSGSWSDPVIWAHYSDKHRGLCLGFELPEMRGDLDSDESAYVEYVSHLLSFPPNFEDLRDEERFEIVRRILFTKFNNWAYEKEIRIWAPLQNEENGTHYLEFEEHLRLIEVIIGAKCTLSIAAIARALSSFTSQVKIKKARAAYDKFEMVEDSE